MKPVLDSERALFRKLEREMYRTLHARTKNHKADHFFNFCMTAHALRDFVLESRGIPPGPARGPHHSAWDADPVIVAAKEIANLSKHFTLRDRAGNLRIPNTRRLVHKRSSVIDVYVNAEGDIEFFPRPSREISITTSDAKRYDAWSFMSHVLNFWHRDFQRHGVRVRRQSLKALLDGPIESGA